MDEKNDTDPIICADEKDSRILDEEDDLGKLEYSLDYDFVKQELSVAILQCIHLPAMDLGNIKKDLKLFPST